MRRGLVVSVAGLAAAGFAPAATAQCQYEVGVVAQHECQPGEGSPTVPTAINSNGDLCGYVQYCTISDDLPFVWTQAGGLELLPVPPGTKAGWANGIHADGRIVGWLNIPGASRSRGFVYDHGQWTMLDPVFPDGPTISSATAIAEDGVSGASSRTMTRRTTPSCGTSATVSRISA